MSMITRGRMLLTAAAWLVVAFLLLPVFITIPVAFNASRFVAMPEGALSLRHFDALVAGEGWIASMAQSAAIALAATILAVTIGTACAVGMWRLTSRFATAVGALVLAPMILPPIVSALALYRAWVALGLYDTWLGVVIAHGILALPFVVIAVTTALTTLDPRLEQASRSVGASVTTTTLRIILPNIKHGIFTAALFAFIVSWDEIVVTLFVSSRAVYTLPRRMWDGIRENVDPTVAAVATLLIAVTLVAVVGILAAQARRSAVPRP